MNARGYTVVEALVALVVLFVLLQGAWTVTRVHAVAALGVIERTRFMEATRIAGWVVHRELRSGISGQDWQAGEDSVSLRAYRGLGVDCDDGSVPGALSVIAHTIRLPEPAKDSLLVLWPDARWRAVALAGVSRPVECDGGAVRGQVWLPEDEAAGGRAVRLFERGSYHVSDGALRYRRGAGGRQPLTDRVLGSASTLQFVDGRVGLELEPVRRWGPGWTSRQGVWPRSSPR